MVIISSLFHRRLWRRLRWWRRRRQIIYSRYKEVSPARVINYTACAYNVYNTRAAKENTTERALFIFVVILTREENFVLPCIIVLYNNIIIYIFPSSSYIHIDSGSIPSLRSLRLAHYLILTLSCLP